MNCIIIMEYENNIDDGGYEEYNEKIIDNVWIR